MHINRYACQSNVHVKLSNSKPKYVLSSNLSNVHPIVSHNICKNVSFSRPDSYVQETEQLNKIFLLLFLLLYRYTYGQVLIEGNESNGHYF